MTENTEIKLSKEVLEFAKLIEQYKLNKHDFINRLDESNPEYPCRAFYRAMDGVAQVSQNRFNFPHIENIIVDNDIADWMIYIAMGCFRVWCVRKEDDLELERVLSMSFSFRRS